MKLAYPRFEICKVKFLIYDFHDLDVSCCHEEVNGSSAIAVLSSAVQNNLRFLIYPEIRGRVIKCKRQVESRVQVVWSCHVMLLKSSVQLNAFLHQSLFVYFFIVAKQVSMCPSSREAVTGRNASIAVSVDQMAPLI